MSYSSFKIFFCLFFINTTAIAKTNFNIPLTYRAQRNHVRVFAQRFDYKIPQPSQIKIGHTLTDFSTFSLKFKVNLDNKIDFFVQWPASLIKDGTIVLKDNNGKALFYRDFNKNDIKVQSISHPEELDLIDETASITMNNQEPVLLEQMSYLPFMVLCIYRIDKDTHINICSDELYVSQQKKPAEIKLRTSKNEKQLIDINGKSVGPQGYIFLTQPNESILLRSQKNTGASLEIETRFYPVEFIDVGLKKIENQKYLEVTGTGLNTYNPKDNISKNSQYWKTQIPFSNPIIYLRGGGGIPLRQEFFIKEDPPDDFIRVYLAENSKNKTYGSKMNLIGVKTSNTSLKSNQPSNKLKFSNKNQFNWSVNGLKKGEENIEELELISDKRSFFPSYSIYRGYPWSISTNLSGLGPDKRISGEFKLEYWFDTLFGIESSHLKPGLEFFYDKKLAATTYKYDYLQFDFKYRFQSTPQLESSSWGIHLPIGMIQFESGSSSLLGLGFFMDQELPQLLSWLGDRWINDFSFLSSSNSNTLESMTRIQVSFLHQINKTNYFNYGLGLVSLGNQSEPTLHLGWKNKL